MQGLHFRGIVGHRDSLPALKVGANLTDKRLVMPHGQRNGTQGAEQHNHHHPTPGFAPLQRSGIRGQQGEHRIGKMPAWFTGCDTAGRSNAGLAEQ
ncbi:hypothetical protein D3C80_1737880 [compost metagenome]